MLNLKLYSRSNNPDLFSMMQELVQHEIEQCTQFQDWWQARAYLHYILSSDADWVVNIDTDAFVLDWTQVERLIEYMQQNNYHYAGMPDGGVCPHRARSWVVMNPFFNVFNLAAMRSTLQSYPAWVINSAGFNADWYEQKPGIVKGVYNHDYVEPYSSLFYFLYAKFTPLYLNAWGHNDGISSILLDHESKPMLYHSWYSREFAVDPTTRERILNLYEEVKTLKNK